MRTIKHVHLTCLPVILAIMVLLFSHMVNATPSGLNNIPTADVAPTGVLVMQQFSNFGSDQQSLYHLGFKYGLAENWEVGLDKRIHESGSGSGVSGAGGMPAGPWVFQAKYRYDLPGGNSSLGLGLANVGEDSDKAGDSYPYAVLSHNLRSFRGHLGYGGKDAARGIFLGVDKTLRGGAVLRADWLQTNDRDESLASIGFLKPLSGPWVIEGWVSFPTAAGVEDTFTLKFDYVFDFKR
ncbi:MAG: hypothetical protein Q7N50_04295 [Armatimonadota bacterium]|nr:hypothetical protein [Armatimonadota bacterium]